MMNISQLLFCLLIIAVFCYFYSLRKPLSLSQSTQTNPCPIELANDNLNINRGNPELENTLDQLITSIRELNNQIK